MRRAARRQVDLYFNSQVNLAGFAECFLNSPADSPSPHSSYQEKRSMRILYCNKYNFGFSGTEAYLFETMELMRSRGHEVALFSMSDEVGPRRTTSTWFRYMISRDCSRPHHAARRPRHLFIRGKEENPPDDPDFRPQVAHVRNIYHHLSPSILWELKAREFPSCIT